MKRALPTMECNSSMCSHYPTSMDWDLQSFGVFNSDMSLVMDSPDSLDSLFSFNSSTGYLEDAIADWNGHCKRGQMISYSHDQVNHQNADDQADPFLNFASEETHSLADDCLVNSSKLIMNKLSTSPAPDETNMRETKQQDIHDHSSSSSSSFQTGSVSKDASVSKGHSGVRIAYPFDVVKPGGTEGEITLKDINRRILMRPTKPVRHPVGDFATPPCISANGFSMSGKAVVALAKIQTKGRGSITIIRTKG